MHTVDLLEQAITAAGKLGVQVREEWFGGSGGGDCEIKGQPCVLLDIAQSPAEQLDQLAAALKRQPRIASIPLDPQLRRLIDAA